MLVKCIFKLLKLFLCAPLMHKLSLFVLVPPGEREALVSGLVFWLVVLVGRKHFGARRRPFCLVGDPYPCVTITTDA